MPSKIVNQLIKRFDDMENKLMDHLIESGGIKTQLKINTWLTGVILVALLARFVTEWFKK